MKYLAIIAALCLTTPAFGQSLELLIAIEKAKHVTPVPIPVVPTPTPTPQPPAPVPNATICDSCDGTGSLGTAICLKCGGDGRMDSLTASGVSMQVAAQRITYMSVEEARASGKPIWLHFGAGSCKPCEKADEMLAKLAAEGKLTKTLSTFACVHDVSPSMNEPSQLAAYYGVPGFPSDLFWSGGRWWRWDGKPPSEAAYISRLNQAREKATSYSYPLRPVNAIEWSGCDRRGQHLVIEHGMPPEVVARMTDAEIQSLHADLHEGKRHAADFVRYAVARK